MKSTQLRDENKKAIKWRDGEINGTHLQGYWNPPYTFVETVARLITVSGQKPVVDGYKCTVDFHGTYEGQVFTLYDYKGDYRIHIGARSAIDLEELTKVLEEEIADAEPTPYEASSDYHGPATLDDGTENLDHIIHAWP